MFGSALMFEFKFSSTDCLLPQRKQTLIDCSCSGERKKFTCPHAVDFKFLKLLVERLAVII